MAESTLDAIMRLLADMSEAEKEQGRKDLKELQRKLKKLFLKAHITVKSLRRAADKLDRVFKDCRTARALGNSSGIIGGAFGIFGGIAIMMSAGAATPLLLVGMGFAIGCAGTKLGTGSVEHSINSTEIKKAEKDLEETWECIDSVQEIVQSCLGRKEEARLLFVYCLARHTLKLGDPVTKLLQQAISSVSNIPEVIWHAATKFFAEVGQSSSMAAAQAGTQAAVQAGTQAAVQAGTQAAVQAGTQAAEQAGIQAAGQTGAQVAEQTSVQAAGEAGVQARAALGAGGLIIGMNVAFLVWDAIDLGFTIRDIIENKGSEAASFLREKANDLEEVLKEYK